MALADNRRHPTSWLARPRVRHPLRWPSRTPVKENGRALLVKVRDQKWHPSADRKSLLESWTFLASRELRGHWTQSCKERLPARATRLTFCGRQLHRQRPVLGLRRNEARPPVQSVWAYARKSRAIERPGYALAVQEQPSNQLLSEQVDKTAARERELCPKPVQWRRRCLVVELRGLRLA